MRKLGDDSERKELCGKERELGSEGGVEGWLTTGKGLWRRRWGCSWRFMEGVLAEVELGMAGDGDGGGDDGGAVARGGGGLRRRRRRLEDGGVAMTTEKNPWPGQGVAAVIAEAAAARRRVAAAAATATVVRLLPQSSLSSHLRGRSLLSFFK